MTTLNADEARAVLFVLNWARGRKTPGDEQATLAARVLAAAARQAEDGGDLQDVRLSATATVRERLLQIQSGNESLTRDEHAAINAVLNLLDTIERAGITGTPAGKDGRQ